MCKELRSNVEAETRTHLRPHVLRVPTCCLYPVSVSRHRGDFRGPEIVWRKLPGNLRDEPSGPGLSEGPSSDVSRQPCRVISGSTEVPPEAVKNKRVLSGGPTPLRLKTFACTIGASRPLFILAHIQLCTTCAFAFRRLLSGGVWGLVRVAVDVDHYESIHQALGKGTVSDRSITKPLHSTHTIRTGRLGSYFIFILLWGLWPWR